MTTQPTVYDTNSIKNQDQFLQMVESLAKTIKSRGQFSVTGNNAQALINAAYQAGGIIDPSTGQIAQVPTTTNNTAGQPTQAQNWIEQAVNASGGSSETASSDYMNNVADSVANAMGFPVPGTSSKGTGALLPKGTDLFSGIKTNAANWGLVIFGAALALGALLISQKSTVIKMAKTAAVVAE